VLREERRDRGVRSPSSAATAATTAAATTATTATPAATGTWHCPPPPRGPWHLDRRPPPPAPRRAHRAMKPRNASTASSSACIARMVSTEEAADSRPAAPLPGAGVGQMLCSSLLQREMAVAPTMPELPFRPCAACRTGPKHGGEQVSE
jgi:hypothetical protein